MHHPARKVSRNKSFSKALLLAIVLVIALFIYHRVTKYGIPGDFFSALEHTPADPSKWIQFSEEQKDSVKKNIAGFWLYEESKADTAVMSLSDRIELKDNGIIWRVTRRTLRLPSGRLPHIISVSNAYINPFSRMKENERILVCESRVMHEAVIRENDTCFGPDNVDDVWEVEGDGKTFRFEGREYEPYDGDIRMFFPGQAIDIIDLQYGKQGTAKPVDQWARLQKQGPGVKAPTGIFAMKQCEGGTDAVSLIRATVAADCASALPARRDAAAITAIIGNYYMPLCLAPAVRRYSTAHAGTTLTVAAKVLQDGGVKDVEVQFPRRKDADRSLSSAVKTEVELWKFAAADEGGEIEVAFKVELNAD